MHLHVDPVKTKRGGDEVETREKEGDARGTGEREELRGGSEGERQRATGCKSRIRGCQRGRTRKSDSRRAYALDLPMTT